MMTRPIWLLVSLVILFGCIAGGYAIGASMSLEALGLVSGFLLGAPIAFAAATGRKRWILVAGINVFVIASFASCGLQTGLYTVVAAILTGLLSLTMAAYDSRSLFGGSTRKALSYYALQSTGAMRGFEIIDEGRRVTTRGTLVGPHLVIIRPGNAVVFEHGSHITRVAGAGITVTSPFESVRAIYSLKRKQSTITLENVLTADLIPLTITAVVNYGIDVSDAAARGEQALSPSEAETIKSLYFGPPDWEQIARASAEEAIRRVFGELHWPEGKQPNTGSFQQRILGLTNNQSLRSAVRVHNVLLLNIQPPRDLIKRKAELDAKREEVSVFKYRLMVYVETCEFALRSGIRPDLLRDLFPPEILREEHGAEQVSSSEDQVYTRLKVDRGTSELPEKELQELVRSVAEHTQTPISDIAVAYVLQGSVLVTLRMPEESASRLVDMYLAGHPMINDLGIREVRIARRSLTGVRPTSKLLAPPIGRNSDIDYIQGLSKTRELVALQPETVRSEFFTLEQRLLDILNDIDLFGATEDTHSRLSRVVHSLNQFVQRIRPAESFNDLCKR